LQKRSGEYATVPTDLYYKYKDDNETLIVYGLNKGETQNPGADYTLLVDSKGASAWNVLKDDKINSLYKLGVNPDTRQYWPIWDSLINTSNGQLVNY
jgi:hypothetical protein